MFTKTPDPFANDLIENKKGKVIKILESDQNVAFLNRFLPNFLGESNKIMFYKVINF